MSNDWQLRSGSLGLFIYWQLKLKLGGKFYATLEKRIKKQFNSNFLN